MGVWTAYYCLFQTYDNDLLDKTPNTNAYMSMYYQ